MKLIKFRIYDPIKKKMNFSGGTPSMLRLFFEQTAVLNTLHEMEYEMFTGLHDKNGVEIFEGDVLTNGYKNFVVKFGDGFDEQTDCSFVGFYIHSKELSGYWALTRDVIDEDGSKVIGNIHENPELIK